MKHPIPLPPPVPNPEPPVKELLKEIEQWSFDNAIEIPNKIYKKMRQVIDK